MDHSKMEQMGQRQSPPPQPAATVLVPVPVPVPVLVLFLFLFLFLRLLLSDTASVLSLRHDKRLSLLYRMSSSSYDTLASHDRTFVKRAVRRVLNQQHQIHPDYARATFQTTCWEHLQAGRSLDTFQAQSYLDAYPPALAASELANPSYATLVSLTCADARVLLLTRLVHPHYPRWNATRRWRCMDAMRQQLYDVKQLHPNMRLTELHQAAYHHIKQHRTLDDFHIPQTHALQAQSYADSDDGDDEACSSPRLLVRSQRVFGTRRHILRVCQTRSASIGWLNCARPLQSACCRSVIV
jgi:hypothetical protein